VSCEKVPHWRWGRTSGDLHLHFGFKVTLGQALPISGLQFPCVWNTTIRFDDFKR
jgi:hypothetical protein